MINTFGFKAARHYVLNVLNAGDVFTLEQLAIAYNGDTNITPQVRALASLTTRTGYTLANDNGKFTRTDKQLNR